MIQKIKFIVGIIIIIVTLIFGIALQVKNPDMTEMRLLITFWKQYLFIVISWVIGCLLMQSFLKDV